MHTSMHNNYTIQWMTLSNVIVSMRFLALSDIYDESWYLETDNYYLWRVISILLTNWPIARPNERWRSIEAEDKILRGEPTNTPSGDAQRKKMEPCRRVVILKIDQCIGWDTINVPLIGVFVRNRSSLTRLTWTRYVNFSDRLLMQRVESAEILRFYIVTFH